MFDLKLDILESESTHATVKISPLRQGMGITLGNSFRRTLYSTMKGAAVTSVVVDGASHEYTALEGIREDVLEITSNLKKLVFKNVIDGSHICRLNVKGVKAVTGADIKLPNGIEIVNKDFIIANITDKSKSLIVEFTVEAGSGYRAVNDEDRLEVGRILLDADFTPVKLVSMTVEKMRVGEDTNWESLVLSVTTDGSIDPLRAITNASDTLTAYYTEISSIFAPFVPEEVRPVIENDKKETVKVSSKTKKKSTVKKKVSKKPVIEINIPVDQFGVSKRLINTIKNAGYSSLEDFSGVSKADIEGIPGLGGKSIEELVEFLKRAGLSLD